MNSKTHFNNIVALRKLAFRSEIQLAVQTAVCIIFKFTHFDR